MEHNAFTQPFVQHVASDMPAVRDRGRGGDDDVLGERHGVEKGVHRNGRARLIGAIGHDDEQVNVAVGPRVPPGAGSDKMIRSGSNSLAMSATILVTTAS